MSRLFGRHAAEGMDITGSFLGQYPAKKIEVGGEALQGFGLCPLIWSKGDLPCVLS